MSSEQEPSGDSDAEQSPAGHSSWGRFVDSMKSSPIGQWAQKSDLHLILTTIGGVYLLFAFLIVLEQGLSVETINPIAGSWRTITFRFAAYGILALALNLQWGYTGMFNIGVAGFMAVGVYTMALVSANPEPFSPGEGHGLGFPLPVGVIAGILMASIIGLVAALPALRLRADYLAIVTLGLSEIIRNLLLSRKFSLWLEDVSTSWFAGLGGVPFSDMQSGVATGGARSFTLPERPTTALWDLSLGGIDIGEILLSTLTGEALASALDLEQEMLISESIVKGFVWAFVVLLFMAGIYWLLRRIGYSPFGRVLKAIREDELVAQSLGKDTRLFKIKVFMLGCGLMGLGGILWQGSRGTVTPNSFKPTITFFVFIAVIIGGSGSNTGSILGAITFVSLLRLLPPQIGRILQAHTNIDNAPNTFQDALGSLAAVEPGQFLAYILENLGPLQLIILGVVLIVFIQKRPDGLLGHRSEVASPISLERGGPNE